MSKKGDINFKGAWIGIVLAWLPIFVSMSIILFIPDLVEPVVSNIVPLGIVGIVVSLIGLKIYADSLNFKGL